MNQVGSIPIITIIIIFYFSIAVITITFITHTTIIVFVYAFMFIATLAIHHVNSSLLYTSIIFLKRDYCG